jgi:hypothetical protein
MGDSLFSTYTKGENRVTASILAVLRSLALGRIERLLGALLEQSEFELVRFQNQPSHGASGVPDAEIVSSCRLLVETKTRPNTINADQLKRHLHRLDQSQEATRCLLLLTPDETRPAVVNHVADPRLIWTSFAALDQAIEELLADKHEVISEREAFLLRELQAMLLEEDLLSSPMDTVVVAARNAWPEYQMHHAYVCQAGRYFQRVQYLAFYAAGQIYPLVPRIVEVSDQVVSERARHQDPAGQLLEKLLNLGLRTEGTSYKVFLLSPPEDIRTVHLDGPILNDLRAASGRPTAFTQGQRYVRLTDLMKVKTTSQLVNKREDRQLQTTSD